MAKKKPRPVDSERLAARAAERAAQREAARQERERAAARKRNLTIGAVVVAIALIIGVGFGLNSLRDTTGTTATEPSGISPDFGLVVGDASAPVEVVIFEDFLCPACGVVEQATNERLTSLADEGRITVEYRPFNFLSNSRWPMRATNAFAVVLDSAGPEAAKAFHDALYAEQPSESGGLPDDDWLVERAVAAGADEDAVRPGIEDLAFEQWVVNATDAASKAGIRQTPTILVNGENVGGDQLDTLVDNIFAAIDAAG